MKHGLFISMSLLSAALLFPAYSHGRGATSYYLKQNYPNPFNPATQITYTLPSASVVSLRIFDVLGREVAALVNERKEVGISTVEWNAEAVPGGVYFYRLVAGDFIETKKMVLMK